MHKFVRDLITEWRKLGLPFSDETMIVAVSGGADSLSLLLALDDLRARKKLKLRLVAAHFNHKLRGHESDADEEFVKHLASEKGFELAIGHSLIAAKGNVEQNARDARYDFLTRTANNLNAYGVVTAHTMNDQAETFLLNLIRGSGMDGLSGMRPIRELLNTETPAEIPASQRPHVSESPFLPFSSTPQLIRPLLTWARRADTENFCRECGVEYRYDTMNEDMSFKRVRIRKILLPVLADLNPKIIETLARTADLMSQAEPPALAGGPELGDTSNEFSPYLLIKDLKILDKPKLYRTLRVWLRTHRGDLRSISLKHIESIERLILSPKSGRLVELPGRGTVRRHDGRLRFENIKVDK
ncbi:MAG: tRNA lysidine(34) synthetase TilS [Pyrinomonadaceae bacterium]